MVYRRVIFLFCLFFIVIECRKKDCEEPINEAYYYPIEAAKGKNLEERVKIFKIPSQTIYCLSTQALIKTCLNYPEMRLIWSEYYLQDGFDKVKEICNGYEELWKRADKFKESFFLYKQKDFSREWESYTDLENGRYLDDIVRIELILSQYEILKSLTKSEKIELFKLTLENQNKKVALARYWGTVGMETTCAILSRIMFIDKYKPLMEEINNNELFFMHIAYIKLEDTDIINKIMSLSVDYLRILKN